eukprot:jgi/Mesvir1/27284/Mv07117-RA.1
MAPRSDGRRILRRFSVALLLSIFALLGLASWSALNSTDASDATRVIMAGYQDLPALSHTGRRLQQTASPDVVAQLLSIKAGLLDGSGALLSWTGDDVCSGEWNGVSGCDDDGNPTSLSLQDDGLSGTIDPALFGGYAHYWSTIYISSPGISGFLFDPARPTLGIPELSNLRVLVIQHTKISGVLPSAISPAMEAIQINRNLISGTIPNAFGGLQSTNLYLNLADNRFWGPIPDGWRNLSADIPGIYVGRNRGLCGPTPSGGPYISFAITSIGIPCPSPGGPTVCFNTDLEEGTDFGCSDTEPVCFKSSARALSLTSDMYLGTDCVGCVDTEAGAAKDFACSDDYPICYENRNPSGGAGCVVCIDDQEGDLPDGGCRNVSRPFCLDWSPFNSREGEGEGEGEGGVREAVVPFRNNGDFGFGLTCVECVDSSSTSTDAGCTDPDKPFCLPIIESAHPAPPYTLPPGINEVGHCVACLDDEPDSIIDTGCTESTPNCVHTHTLYTREGEFQFPIASEGHCVACRDTSDDEPAITDEHCPDDAPYCVYANEIDRYGLYCSPYANPVCLFTTVDVERPYTATCPSEVALVANIVVDAENCSVTSLDLTRLAVSMGGMLKLPTCSVELTLLSPAEILPVTPSRRHLLQIDHYPITLLFKAFVSDVPSGTALLEVFQMMELAALLSLFEAEFGDIISISANDTRVLQLSVATSDPHFVTPGGFKFDFNGRADQTFCIVTDERLQINAHFMGAADSSSAATQLASDARTWMDQVAILSGNDKVLVEAASAPGAPYSTSFGTVRLNGELVSGRLAFKKSASGLTVTRKKSRVVVTIPGVAVVELEVVRAAFWEPDAGPGRNFLNLQVKQFNSMGAVHGVLGQSFAVGFDNRLQGGVDDYITSGIFNADCRFNHFNPSSVREPILP